jgi:hypothetical protein
MPLLPQHGRNAAGAAARCGLLPTSQRDIAARIC